MLRLRTRILSIVSVLISLTYNVAQAETHLSTLPYMGGGSISGSIDYWDAFSRRAPEGAQWECNSMGMLFYCVLPTYTAKELANISEAYHVTVTQSRQLGDYYFSIFADTPIPILPIDLFTEESLQRSYTCLWPSCANGTCEGEVCDGTDPTERFNEAKLLGSIRALTASTMVGIPEWLFHHRHTPSSFEDVSGKPLLEAAWTAWGRLTGARVGLAEKEAPKIQKVVAFRGDGAQAKPGFQAKHGVAICNFRENGQPEEPSFADTCFVMAYEDSQGRRYVKALYGPYFDTNTGGRERIFGVAEGNCSFSTPEQAHASFSSAFRGPKLELTVLNEVSANPRRILRAAKHGQFYEPLGRFAYLDLTIDYFPPSPPGPEGYSIRLIARESDRNDGIGSARVLSEQSLAVLMDLIETNLSANQITCSWFD